MKHFTHNSARALGIAALAVLGLSAMSGAGNVNAQTPDTSVPATAAPAIGDDTADTAPTEAPIDVAAIRSCLEQADLGSLGADGLKVTEFGTDGFTIEFGTDADQVGQIDGAEDGVAFDISSDPAMAKIDEAINNCIPGEVVEADSAVAAEMDAEIEAHLKELGDSVDCPLEQGENGENSEAPADTNEEGSVQGFAALEDLLS